MRFTGKKEIVLDKELNDLDRFVFRFIKILEKHADYVIVSGYVGIILGRNRGTDDIDVIIPKISKDDLQSLYSDLIKKGYWCINSGDIEDLYHILISKSSIRFALKPGFSPNMELKFAKDEFDLIALKDPIMIRIGDKRIKTSFLELQIAYKEEVLKSNKDIEDAQFLRSIGKEFIDELSIKEYKKRLRS
ncbi:hypothetical protein KY358_05950 [Candidatus Woesearchaeota archaeon]|nr:hypothetical protein [Candidatus Woesearchaeota archaeon]